MSTPSVNVNINPQPPAAPAPNPAPVARAGNLRTNRSLLKMFLLGLVTFGIYTIWQMSEIGESLNLIASRRDGRKTMHYCLLLFLVGPLTLGIAWFVWGHRISERIGDELAARNLPMRFGAADYWLWNVLGAFIIVGPFIYTHRLCKAMNQLSADWNTRG